MFSHPALSAPLGADGRLGQGRVVFGICLLSTQVFVGGPLFPPLLSIQEPGAQLLLRILGGIKDCVQVLPASSNLRNNIEPLTSFLWASVSPMAKGMAMDARTGRGQRWERALTRPGCSPSPPSAGPLLPGGEDR